MNDQLTPLGLRLVQLLETHENYEHHLQKQDREDTFHVQNTGHIVSSLYEQLRNASEYTEEHLLLRRAIRRFYSRSLPFMDRVPPHGLAEELITELTLAEYISNDTVSLEKIRQINELIESLFQMCWQVASHPKEPAIETAREWSLDMMAVRTEQILNRSVRMASFLNFAFAYYSQHIVVAKHLHAQDHVPDDTHDTILYIALHQALLKSDTPTIRSMLLDLYNIQPDNTEQIIALNKRFDSLITLKTTDKITRIINKNGAQLRIVHQAFFDANSTAKSSLLSKRKQVSTVIRQAVEDEYRDTRKRLNRGIVKSIIFLLITKAIIGLGLEIPYDLAVYDHIAWLPLIINLFFPAVFIAFTTLTLAMPGEANTNKIVQTIDSILYEQSNASTQATPLRTFGQTRHSKAFSIVYSLLFVVVIGAVIQGLFLLNFNIMQILIFIVFLSTAAFLSYRLSLQVKSLEMVSAEASIFSLLRDFLYTPFIFIGHQISSRYAKINLVARLLDNAIELPLKTTLRIIRQWTNFLSTKKDEIL